MEGESQICQIFGSVRRSLYGRSGNNRALKEGGGYWIFLEGNIVCGIGTGGGQWSIYIKLK